MNDPQGLHHDLGVISTMLYSPELISGSNPCLSSLEIKMAVSNALHKSREVLSVALPSSITAITPQKDAELEINYTMSSTLRSLTRCKESVGRIK